LFHIFPFPKVQSSGLDATRGWLCGATGPNVTAELFCLRARHPQWRNISPARSKHYWKIIRIWKWGEHPIATSAGWVYFCAMKVLLLYPEFPDTFWSFKHALKFIGKKAALSRPWSACCKPCPARSCTSA
jgi:hypothetical protein